MTNRIQQHIASLQNRVEIKLDNLLPKADQSPAQLHQAMRYSTLGGGKRIRAILVYLTGEALGITPDALDSSACAIECIHAYSLIHDDLPAMDDDDLRRGKATCHKAFDEATAILAGDALQTLAFQLLVQNKIDDSEMICKKVELLATASGSCGMVGGQCLDIISTDKMLTLEQLEHMHQQKTGALLTASVLLGAYSTKSIPINHLNHLKAYSHCIGLAFQIQDDILDVEGNTTVLGKSQGSDINQNKATYPSILGLEASRKYALEHTQKAIQHLSFLGDTGAALAYIASYITQRDR